MAGGAQLLGTYFCNIFDLDLNLQKLLITSCHLLSRTMGLQKSTFSTLEIAKITFSSPRKSSLGNSPFLRALHNRGSPFLSFIIS